MGAVRLSEPELGVSNISLAPSDAPHPFTPGSGAGEALWDTHWSFFTGSAAAPSAVLDAAGVQLCAGTVLLSKSDVERMDAAMQLGATVAAGFDPTFKGDSTSESDIALAAEAALEALCALFCDVQHESARRAALYALATANEGAVWFLLKQLREPTLALPANSTGTTPCVLYALGNAATTARTLAVAVDGASEAIKRALTWIDEREKGMADDDFQKLPSGNVYREGVQLSLDVIQRRRECAAGAHCLGLLAQRGRRAGMNDVCLKVLDCILPMITRVEPAERWPSFMGADTVRYKAANALLRLCTSTTSKACMARISPQAAGVSVLQGMVNAALARLSADLHGGGGNDNELVGALADRLSQVEWGWDTSAALFTPMTLH